MDHGHSTLGFVVIVILYAVIGLVAAAGTIFIARQFFAPRQEQIFYAKFLIMIAAFYLAFAYFEAASAWRLETAVVVGFAALALPSARLPLALIAGYSLHGLWDLLHELQAHGAHSVIEPGRLTPIPLAYVFLCSLGYLHGGVYLWAPR